MCSLYSAELLRERESWLADMGFFLSIDIEINRRSGGWHNVSLIKDYPHWVFKRTDPLGRIQGVPQPQEPSINVLQIHEKLCRLRRIWRC